MKFSLKIIGGALLFGAVLAGSPAARALSLDITVDGSPYRIRTETSSQLNRGAFARNEQGGVMPWWGDSSRAERFAAAVADSLGLPNAAGTEAPYFAYAISSFIGISIPSSVWRTASGGGSANFVQVIPGGEVIYATGEEVPAPLPLMGAAAGLTWSRRLRRRIGMVSGRR